MIHHPVTTLPRTLQHMLVLQRVISSPHSPPVLRDRRGISLRLTEGEGISTRLRGSPVWTFSSSAFSFSIRVEIVTWDWCVLRWCVFFFSKFERKKKKSYLFLFTSDANSKFYPKLKSSLQRLWNPDSSPAAVFTFKKLMEFTSFHVLNAQSHDVGKSTELTCLKSRIETNFLICRQ